MKTYREASDAARKIYETPSCLRSLSPNEAASELLNPDADAEVIRGFKDGWEVAKEEFGEAMPSVGYQEHWQQRYADMRDELDEMQKSLLSLFDALVDSCEVEPDISPKTKETIQRMREKMNRP